MIHHIGDKSTHITIVPDIIDLELCAELIESCKKDWNSLFYAGPTIAGVDFSVKYTMDFDFSGEQAKNRGCNYELYKSYEDKVVTSLWTAVSLYTEAYPELRQCPNLWDSGFRLQRYQKGVGFYRRHHDGAPWDPDPTSRRVLGVVMYLNTIERGGETSFPEHNLKTKATAGSIALFPASWTHPHQSCVPVSSDKWMISSFILCDRRLPALNEPPISEDTNLTPDVPVTFIDTNPANQEADTNGN